MHRFCAELQILLPPPPPPNFALCTPCLMGAPKEEKECIPPGREGGRTERGCLHKRRSDSSIAGSCGYRVTPPPPVPRGRLVVAEWVGRWVGQFPRGFPPPPLHENEVHATILCCYAPPPPVPPTQLPGTGGREDSWRRRRRPTTAVKKRQQSFVFSSSSFRFLHLPASVPPPPSLIWFFGSQQPLPPTSNRPFPFVFFCDSMS